MIRPVLVAVLVVASACSGETAKDATGAVVGKTVELAKGATSGVVEGMREGRKDAPSVDGAVVVSTWEELATHGEVSVFAKSAVDGNPGAANVEIAIENKGDKPLRLSNVDVLGVDADGFVLKPVSGSLSSQTVPAKAKVKEAIRFDVAPAKVTKVRVWSKDLATP